MKAISTRLGQEEIEYLKRFASKKSIKMSKALRLFIEFAAKNNIDIEKKVFQDEDKITKMIEQIHNAVPHLMYLSRLNSGAITASLTQNELSTLQQKSIKDTTLRCGDMQSINYTCNYFTINKQGMKEMPLNEGDNQWKSV